jgi:hypothetical protein
VQVAFGEICRFPAPSLNTLKTFLPATADTSEVEEVRLVKFEFVTVVPCAG